MAGDEAVTDDDDWQRATCGPQPVPPNLAPSCNRGLPHSLEISSSPSSSPSSLASSSPFSPPPPFYNHHLQGHHHQSVTTVSPSSKLRSIVMQSQPWTTHQPLKQMSNQSDACIQKYLLLYCSYLGHHLYLKMFHIRRLVNICNYCLLHIGQQLIFQFCMIFLQ